MENKNKVVAKDMPVVDALNMVVDKVVDKDRLAAMEVVYIKAWVVANMLIF